MTVSRRRTDSGHRTPTGMWTTLLLGATLIGIPVLASAQANATLCALLPAADVGAVVGTPVKLSTKPAETHKIGGGTERSQECVYDGTRGGLGSPQVRVEIDEVSSPTLAAQWFKEQAELFDKFMAGSDGKGRPLKGVGDDAFVYPGGSIYMRKQRVTVHVTIFSGDSGRHLEQSKQLALKVAARVR